MTRTVWISLLRCVCGLAGASCADALGLRDLLQGGDGGNAEAESTSWTDGGGDSATALNAPLDGGHDSIDDAGRGKDAPAAAATALDGAIHDAAGFDAMDGAIHDATGSDAVDGAIHDAAGSDTPLVDAAQGGSDAAVRDAGGEDASCNGCGACTVHSNGVGQRFQDCAPNGTYNATQARAACAAFTGDGASCTIESCSTGIGAPLGAPKANDAACSTGSSVCNCWTFAGPDVGLVQSASPYLCEPCWTGGAEWN